MRKLRDSDLFMKEINRNDRVFSKLNKIFSGAEPSTVILNEILYPEIKRKIVDKKKETSAVKMLKAIEEGRLILFIVDPSVKLDDMMPFFEFKANGLRKVGVHLTNIVVKEKNDDGSFSYSIGQNIDKAYIILHCAYLLLDKLDTDTMPPAVLLNGAVAWAEVFNKPLYDAVGLNNLDRRDAFMYFAMKFFLVYYMECKEDQAESITMSYFGKKNYLIIKMDDEIKKSGINIYDGLLTFLNVLFNDDVTQIKGLCVNHSADAMNVNTYLKRFIVSYSQNALLALCSFPYFLFVIMAAMSKTKLVKDKSFEKILNNHSREVNRMIISVMKD